MLRYGAHLELAVFSVWIAILLASGYWARFQFLRDPRSLRRLFRLFQFGGWPLGLVLASSGWHILLLTNAQAASGQYVFATLAGASAAYLGFTFYYATQWDAGQSMYQELSRYTDVGTISANRLLGILSYSGRSTRMVAVIPAIAGIGMVGTIIASALLGRHAVGTILYVVMSFGVAPYLMAMLTSRIWLQRKYLGSTDLRIVG